MYVAAAVFVLFAMVRLPCLHVPLLRVLLVLSSKCQHYHARFEQFTRGFCVLQVVTYVLFEEGHRAGEGWPIFGCVLTGLAAGMIIGKFTEYFTSFDFGPVKSIKDRGMTGPATVVIQGLGVGMISTVPPVIVLAVTILVTHNLGGTYGVAISAVGMLSTLGITLATDAYGPVAGKTRAVSLKWRICPQKYAQLRIRLMLLATPPLPPARALPSAQLCSLHCPCCLLSRRRLISQGSRAKLGTLMSINQLC